jgi:hypothetical protein
MADTYLVEASPFDRFVWVTVEFLSADQDLLIGHNLEPEDPNDVHYLVMANDGPGVIYDSRRLAFGLSWTRDTIALRCSRGPSTVTLLLVVPRVLVDPDPL